MAGCGPWPFINTLADDELRADLEVAHALREEYGPSTTEGAIGGGTIGALDLLIFGIGVASAALLFGFLRFTKLGWAVRATALDRDAAKQVGVDVDAVNQTVFAIASALGGLSGLLVDMYYNTIDAGMGFQATLKGVVALLIGWIALDYRSQKQRLRELEQSGVARRSGRSATDMT